MITYTILGVPYSNYSIMHPQNPILIIWAPTLSPGDAGRARLSTTAPTPFELTIPSSHLRSSAAVLSAGSVRARL